MKAVPPAGVVWRWLAAGFAASMVACTRAAPPAVPPEGAVVAVPAPLASALTTRPQIETAADLRTSLRALWPGMPLDAECESANRDSGAPPGLLRHALADGSWLIEVACAQGAYQGSFWVAHLWPSPGAPTHAAVLRWQVAAESASASPSGFDVTVEVEVWGELAAAASPPGPRADATIVNRFRGIGDCGTRSRHAIERGTTRLVALAASFICAETLPAVPPGPADWPTVPLPDR